MYRAFYFEYYFIILKHFDFSLVYIVGQKIGTDKRGEGYGIYDDWKTSEGYIIMELFGLPIQTIYLYVLIISGLCIILYLFFGDVIEGISEATGFLNPVLILAFLIFMSATGYLLETLTELSTFLIMGIAAIVSLILDTLLNVFVLIPLANTEESLAYTEDSLKGRIANVLIPIPEDGFGEILIDSISGRISKPAASFENKKIEAGTKVLIIDVKEGVLYVVPRNEY